MGGIIPNKEDAITPGILWAVSFPGGTTYDLNDATSFGGLTERLNWRDQPNVIEFLKQQVKAFPEWVGAANSVFDGFRRGVPGGDNVPLPLAIVEVFTSQILGLPPGTWATVNDATTAISGIPGVPELAQLITQIPGVVTDPRATIATWAANLQGFLSGVDLNNPALDVVTALSNWITTNILPLIVVGIGDVSGLGAALAALAPIDTIMNALGVAGSGFGTTDLTTALTHIPGANLVSVAAGIVTGVLAGGNIPGLDASKIISGSFPQTMIAGLAASLAALAPIDTLVNALGVTGTGHTITDLTTAMTHIPGANLVSVAAGIVTGVLAGSNIPGLDATKIISGTFAQTLIPSLTGGWGGTIDSSLLSGLLGAGLIPGLDATKIISGQLAQARAAWAAPIDTLVQAWGGTGTGFLPADLITFASAIPHDNLTGNLGGSNIANTINRFLDGGVQAVQNNPALSNQTIAQWSNALSGAMGFLGWNPAGATPPNSVAAIASNSDATLKARAVQKDPNANIDRTMDATFDLKEVMTATSLPTVAVTQGNPLSAPINVRDGGVKQTATFKGYLTGTLTKCYVNLYHVSPTTGTWTWFYSTADYHASIATGTTPQYNFIPIPAAQYVNTAAGDIIQAEIVVFGSGTLNIVGKTLSNQLLPMTGIFPGFPAAQRLATTAPTYITSQANMGFGNGGSGTVTVDQACSDTGAMLIFRMYRTTNAGAGGLTVGGQGVNTVGGADNYFLQSGIQSFWAELFYIRNPPAGAQTLSAAGGSGVTNINVGIIQLANVGSIQGYVGQNGTSANPAYTIPAGYGATNTITVAAFASDAGSVTGTTGFANSVVNGTSYELAMGTVNFDAAAHPITMVNATSSQWAMQICNITGLALQPTTGFTVANPSAPGTTGVPAAYNRLQPWLGLSGAALVTSYSPVIDPYATPGTGISIQNPAVKYPWANNFDIVVCSDGSGGEGGGYPVGGVGGKAGTFTRVTLTRAQIGTANIILNIGGGSGGTAPGVGGSSAAGGVSAVISGWGTVSQSGAPGSGSGLSPSAYGVAGDSSAGITYNDANGTSVTFGGGAGGAGGQAPGSQPGGGGSGGNATYMPNFNGGPGGAAQVWIRSYQ